MEKSVRKEQDLHTFFALVFLRSDRPSLETVKSFGFRQAVWDLPPLSQKERCYIPWLKQGLSRSHDCKRIVRMLPSCVTVS